LVGDATSIFAMAMMAKAQNSAAATPTPGTDKKTNSQILASAKTVVANYPSKSMDIITNFNAQYSKAGISMDTNGTPSKTYAQAKADIEAEIKSIKANMTDDDTKTEGVQNNNKTAYDTAKSTYEGYASALQSYDNYTSTIDNMKTTQGGKTIEITGEGDAMKAKGMEPDASQFTQYLSPEQQESCKVNGKIDQSKLETLAKQTSKYQTAKQTNEQQATTFNSLVEGRKNALPSGVNSRSDLEKKMTEAKKVMDEAGAKTVNANGQTAAQHDMAVKNLESKLAALGTKEDFDAAVKEMTELKKELAEAKAIIAADATATEDANALANSKRTLKSKKQGGHTGLRGKFYDIFHKDSKTKGVAAAKADVTARTDDANTSLTASQQLYAKYYDKT
ncbi:MAG: hypothetical protein NC200_07950, partial [Candidatus Gastranaerophilales bacterium]|nr:hypothetical protein [Candidatus Gastranaerophilales bacterium]